MINIFHWHHAYYVPWAKGALNRHVPGCRLVDNADTEESGYRSAIRWWRENNGLGSSVIFDEATQNSLIKADQKQASYIGWVQTALTIAGFPVFTSGYTDPKTSEAIRKFQKQRMGSTKPDGVVGPKTETALMLWSFTRAPGRVKDVPKYNNYIDPWKPPVPDDPFDVPAIEALSTAWVGFGVKVSAYDGPTGPLPVSTKGREDVGAVLLNWQCLQAGFGVHIRSTRQGFNAGGSVGAAAVVITGIRDPKRLDSLTLDEWDFSVATGAKWTGLWKSLKLMKGLNPSAIGAAVRAFKASGQLGPALLESADTLKKAVEAAGIDVHGSKPDCVVLDISAGAELSMFKKTTTFNVGQVVMPS